MEWCKKQGLIPESYRNFYALLELNTPFPIKKVRRAEGYYLKDICLKEEVLHRDNIYGGTLLNAIDLENGEGNAKEKVKNGKEGNKVNEDKEEGFPN
jgi:hypothetical protein